MSVALRAAAKRGVVRRVAQHARRIYAALKFVCGCKHRANLRKWAGAEQKRSAEGRENYFCLASASVCAHTISDSDSHLAQPKECTLGAYDLLCQKFANPILAVQKCLSNIWFGERANYDMRT
jgi:hypothetical protein